MKVTMMKDEWWPVWFVSEGWGSEYNIPIRTLNRLALAEREFKDAQNEVAMLIKEQEKK